MARNQDLTYIIQYKDKNSCWCTFKEFATNLRAEFITYDCALSVIYLMMDIRSVYPYSLTDYQIADSQGKTYQLA